MKKLASLLAIVTTMQFAFAADAPVTGSQVLGSFNSDFYMATDVQWQHSGTYDKASFAVSGQVMDAFYTPDGELIAVTRNIVAEQLPLKLLMQLKKNYSSYWISGLFEVVNGADDDYYITLENADEQLILKAKATKSWKMYKKVVKI